MKTVILFFCFTILANCIRGQDATVNQMSEGWNLYYGPSGKNAPANPDELKSKNWPMVPASVPGNVELDLLASGKIKNPETGNNIYDLRQYEAYQWWYTKSFKSPKFTTGERVELVFDGLDCFGTIWVNNTLAGKTDNMFISHRFDITDMLNSDGNNNLYIKIDPAVAEGRKFIDGTVESRNDFTAEYIHVRDADSGTKIYSGSFEIPVNGKTLIGNIPENHKQSMWLIEYSIGNENYTNHFLTGKPPYKLDDYHRWYKKFNIKRD